MAKRVIDKSPTDHCRGCGNPIAPLPKYRAYCARCRYHDEKRTGKKPDREPKPDLSSDEESTDCDAIQSELDAKDLSQYLARKFGKNRPTLAQLAQALKSDGYSKAEILDLLGLYNPPIGAPSQLEVERFLFESNFSRREARLAIAFIYMQKGSTRIARALAVPKDWVKTKLRAGSPLGRAILKIRHHLRTQVPLPKFPQQDYLALLEVRNMELTLGEIGGLARKNVDPTDPWRNAGRSVRYPTEFYTMVEFLRDIRRDPSILLRLDGQQHLRALVDLLEAAAFGKSAGRVGGIEGKGTAKEVSRRTSKAMMALTTPARGGALGWPDHILASIVATFRQRVVTLRDRFKALGAGGSLEGKLEKMRDQHHGDFARMPDQELAHLLQSPPIAVAAALAQKATNLRREVFLRAYRRYPDAPPLRRY